MKTETVKLLDLIGQLIVDIRFQFKQSNEYGLQEFYCYLKLESGQIIGIPRYNNDVLYNLTEDNIDYYQACFENGTELNPKTRKLLLNQTIQDILFCYYEDEVDEDKSTYIKLGNGLYVTENNHGPQGLTDIDLLVFEQNQFNQRTSTLEENVKSYKNEIKTFANKT
ncbi:hypothetical protein [Lacihabitans sp. LS3-19]|uniref:hypothetical protein n=1 Tax=Lacihabitans sp. LS3-19 TaxID=2487335 RepID=UPI0020CDC09C|nr:hypothetical protein [Lacihabitans sp. LS3-19]